GDQHPSCQPRWASGRRTWWRRTGEAQRRWPRRTEGRQRRRLQRGERRRTESCQGQRRTRRPPDGTRLAPRKPPSPPREGSSSSLNDLIARGNAAWRRGRCKGKIMEPSTQTPRYAELFIEGLKEANVTIVAAVPESLLAGVYRMCAKDKAIRYIPVTNE